ncbi:MAG: winged helix-turn-helix transcriptional regulator [Alphaproteobacteria bacterium]|nr:winged helix-turn-helix transcriptional regulator [Alphaproteobacteria bacterium]
MTSDIESKPEICNCSALRQAARHVTRFYDAFLFPAGLRTTQFSILAKLWQRGPLTITALAAEMVMDRTTLGRNIRPLQRKGLVAVVSGRRDHRSKELHLTETGLERLRAVGAPWREAQQRFDALFGVERASALRKLLHIVSVTDLTRAAAE